MKIAVISLNNFDFMNHLKDSEHEYVYLCEPEMACGNKFDKIEIAPEGKRNKKFNQIKSYCEFRLIH